MDLRHVVHRRDAVVELAQASEQLVDVDVLRPVHGRELQEDVFEVGRAAADRAGLVVDQHPLGKEAAQCGLELVGKRMRGDAAFRVGGRLAGDEQDPSGSGRQQAMSKPPGFAEVRRVHQVQRCPARIVVHRSVSTILVGAAREPPLLQRPPTS